MVDVKGATIHLIVAVDGFHKKSDASYTNTKDNAVKLFFHKHEQ